MTNKQILKKAIEKAVKNGYIPPKAWEAEGFKVTFASPFEIIFSHDFAEKFWGKEWKDGDVIETPMSEILAQENIMPWQHHLKKMVLEKEPLLYLKQFIDK